LFHVVLRPPTLAVTKVDVVAAEAVVVEDAERAVAEEVAAAVVKDVEDAEAVAMDVDEVVEAVVDEEPPSTSKILRPFPHCRHDCSVWFLIPRSIKC
jgi:formaldehyde-activating enzyme involved in methanogenesis